MAATKLVGVAIACALLAMGCREGFEVSTDAADREDDASSTPIDGAPNLPQPIFFIDAANADGAGGAGTAGCPQGAMAWKDLVSETEGALTGFVQSCAGEGGWAGSGAPDDPFRLAFSRVTDQRVLFGVLGTAQRYTVTAWVRWTGGGTGAESGGGNELLIPIVAKGTAETDVDAVDVNYWLGIDPDTSALGTDFEDEVGNNGHRLVGGRAVAVGEWQHTTVSYEQTSQRLYLEAQLDTAESETDVPSNATASVLTIGADSLSDGTPGGGYFEGDIAVVRIYDVGLSLDEVQRDCELFVDRFAGASCGP